MEAYVYDHVRTPRGKGRPDGALHEITSVEMARQLLEAVRDRNQLDTSLLDDVIIGMAQPVGEQGGVLARAAVLQAGRSEEHTSELQSLMRTSYAVFCLKKKKQTNTITN